MVEAPRRSTSQRTAVTEVLAGTEEFVTAQELHSVLRHTGARIGLATVYRTLADLVAAGEVDTLRGNGGETLYRQCGDAEHHHHLVCRVCGRTEEVTAPGVERWAATVAEQYGFHEVGHQVELFGVCAACANAAGGGADAAGGGADAAGGSADAAGGGADAAGAGADAAGAGHTGRTPPASPA